MKLHNIDTQKGSFALTMLSFAECITYITASFLGDYIKGALNVLQVTGGCRKATRNKLYISTITSTCACTPLIKAQNMYIQSYTTCTVYKCTCT